jgi:protein-disulfide isomerase
MDTASPQPPPASPVPPAPRSREATIWSYVVPVLCLAATAAFWWQTRSELAAMRVQQQELVQVLDAVRGTATLDVTGDPALGPDDAVVTLVEFSDYECPFCIRHFVQTMPEIVSKYLRSGQIRYVFKDLPIDQLHPEAIRAHEAARCAGEQDKFWEMHGRMFSPAGSHTTAALEQHATDAGVSLDAFRACMSSGRHTDAIRASVARASELGANGTPAFFIGLRDPQTNRVRLTQAISGAHPFAEFEKAIDAALAQAAAQ